MNNDFDFSDDDFERAFKHAGSEAAPSESHLEALRLSLLARTQQRSGLPDKVMPAEFEQDTRDFPILQTTGKLAVVAAIVAIVFIVFRPFSGTAAADFRLALDATRMQHWIHAKTQIEYNGMLNEFESWCSPHDRIAAFRSEQGLHFINYQDSLQSSFSHQSNVIYQWRADQHMEDLGRTFVLALLSDDNLQGMLPMHDVSSVEKKPIDVSGQAQIQYSFESTLKSDPSVHWMTFVTADQSNGQILSWVEQHAGGMQVRTTFDYPATGPRSIYELGASEQAKIVDRIADSNIVEMAEQFREEIFSFGDYEALVIDRTLNVDGNQQGPPLLRRLRRKGHQFSVDLLSPLKEDLQIPADAGLEWWKTHAGDFESIPLAKCDGTSCTIFASNDSRLVSSDDMIPRVDKQTMVPVSVVRTESQSTTIPIWPSIWPEYVCRPLLMITDPSVRFDVDPEGKNGPANSLRIRVLTPENPVSKERISYWLSPETSYCVIKASFQAPDFGLHSAEISEREIESEFSDFERSPSGVHYARSRMQTVSGESHKQLTTWILDFDRPE